MTTAVLLREMAYKSPFGKRGRGRKWCDASTASKSFQCERVLDNAPEGLKQYLLYLFFDDAIDIYKSAGFSGRIFLCAIS